MSCKVCSECKEEKGIEEYWYKNKLKNIRQPKCKSCTLIYQKKHYRESKSRRIKIHKANGQLRERNYLFVNDYLKKNPCIDCGENDPIVLEFDHVSIESKNKNISIMVRDCNSLEKIKEEIQKCEIRCCNCHRRRTAKQFKWRVF